MAHLSAVDEDRMYRVAVWWTIRSIAELIFKPGTCVAVAAEISPPGLIPCDVRFELSVHVT